MRHTRAAGCTPGGSIPLGSAKPVRPMRGARDWPAPRSSAVGVQQGRCHVPHAPVAWGGRRALALEGGVGTPAQGAAQLKVGGATLRARALEWSSTSRRLSRLLVGVCHSMCRARMRQEVGQSMPGRALVANHAGGGAWAPRWLQLRLEPSRAPEELARVGSGNAAWGRTVPVERCKAHLSAGPTGRALLCRVCRRGFGPARPRHLRPR